MFNGGRNTGGSRFYISQQPNEQLDGRYTVFGRIVENLDAIYNFSAINKTGIIPDPGDPGHTLRLALELGLSQALALCGQRDRSEQRFEALRVETRNVLIAPSRCEHAIAAG